ncbi:MAG: hypothetical protein WDN69_25165 [Aliidongia sp.]
MVSVVHRRYEAFDALRRTAEARVADANEIAALEALGKKGDRMGAPKRKDPGEDSR